MILLKNLVPLNLQEEKVKFFADNSYNPQFTYASTFPVAELQELGLPQRKYLDIAHTILDQAYAQKNEEELFATEGARLTQDEVTEKTMQFLQMHHLDKRFSIIWSSSFVSRTSITSDTIKFRLPADFRREGLLGMLYHEIGTHALRRINYEQQPWFKRKKKFGFKDYSRTEEGLAVLHGLIPHTYKLAFIPAIRYLAVHYAQTHSFAELWQFLSRYVDDVERRWIIAFRQKRGITDTSKPGGSTKDLVYFEGMVQVWYYLRDHGFDPTALYYGKLAWEDAKKAVEMKPHFRPLLPSFFVVNPDEYRKQLLMIGEENMLR